MTCVNNLVNNNYMKMFRISQDSCRACPGMSGHVRVCPECPVDDWTWTHVILSGLCVRSCPVPVRSLSGHVRKWCPILSEKLSGKLSGMSGNVRKGVRTVRSGLRAEFAGGMPAWVPPAKGAAAAPAAAAATGGRLPRSGAPCMGVVCVSANRLKGNRRDGRSQARVRSGRWWWW